MAMSTRGIDERTINVHDDDDDDDDYYYCYYCMLRGKLLQPLSREENDAVREVPRKHSLQRRFADSSVERDASLDGCEMVKRKLENSVLVARRDGAGGLKRRPQPGTALL